MKPSVYLAISAVGFCALATLHVFSYFGAVSASQLTIGFIAALLLVLPIIAAYFQRHRSEQFVQAWQVFWKTSLEHCPKWVSGLSAVAWLLAIVALLRSMLTDSMHTAEFHSAWCLVVASMALSFAFGSWRREAAHEKNA